MKAWIVRDEYDEYSTVVFAETRSEARLAAMATDCCGDMDYIAIRPVRFPEADSMYRGGSELEWDDPEARVFLVEHGWSCVEKDYSECAECAAAEICEDYLEYLKECLENELDSEEGK